MLIFGFHYDGHCLGCVFMVVYNNTAYLVKMDFQADHQLFCQLRTHGKKLCLTLSVLDWLKAQLEECSVYEIAQNRLQCRSVFCCFQGVEKGCIGNKWGKFPLTNYFSKICFLFRFWLKKAMYVQKSFLEKRNRYLSASQSLQFLILNFCGFADATLYSCHFIFINRSKEVRHSLSLHDTRSPIHRLIFQKINLDLSQKYEF